MTEEVCRWIADEKLIETGDTVIVGVSGGADSVCLFLLLLEYRRKVEFSLQVVHVEHGIRGAESEADAVFVEKLCKEHRIPCEICHVDVPFYAREHRMGIEEAARHLRYECFYGAAEKLRREACNAGGFPNIKIALAHHADDNAETMLFQMARGSGLRGLSGMRSMRQAKEGVLLIRPLLAVTRETIEDYLKDCGQNYRVDVTNQDIEYSRNRIRHEVMPQLKQLNPQVVSHMGQSARMLAEVDDYIASERERVFRETCTTQESMCILGKELFVKYLTFLQKEVVHHVICMVAGSSKDIGNVHVEAVCKLAALQVGRRISLPYDMVAERVYEGICIRKGSKDIKCDECAGLQTGKIENIDARASVDTEQDVDLKEEQKEHIIVNGEMFSEMEDGDWREIALGEAIMRMRIYEFNGEMGEIPKKTYTKHFNYDKIEGGLQIRKRAGGDYLTIDKMGHRKKLKAYFVDEKIPQKQRDDIWLVADGTHIVWVVGGRISAGYKVEQSTKKILEIQMIGGKYHEDQEY